MEKEKQLPSLLSLKVDPPEQLQENSNEVVLPQALEDVLALKNQRALELGDEETESNELQDKTVERNLSDDEENTVVDSKDDKKSKNKNKRKKKKKKNRNNKKIEDEPEKDKKNDSETGEKDVEVEYIQESLGLHELAPQYRQFFHIFEAFKIADPMPTIAPPVLALPTSLSSKPIATVGDQFTEEATEETDEKKIEDKTKLSKRKLKKLTRLSVAELKQLVHRPDVVEMHDVTARDPKLLVQLKAHR